MYEILDGYGFSVLPLVIPSSGGFEAAAVAAASALASAFWSKLSNFEAEDFAGFRSELPPGPDFEESSKDGGTLELFVELMLLEVAGDSMFFCDVSCDEKLLFRMLETEELLGQSQGSFLIMMGYQ